MVIQDFKNAHAGKTFVCVGSGPSLKETNLPVKDKVVIAVNHTYSIFKHTQAYAIITDVIRMKELRQQILDHGNTLFGLANTHNVDPRLYEPPVVLLQPKLCRDKTAISLDWSRPVYCGHSVIFPAIILAAYMGAAKIHIVGVDQDYTQPQKFFADDIQRASTPRLSDYELNRPMFETIHAKLQTVGIPLVNSTVGGKVDCIPREELV